MLTSAGVRRGLFYGQKMERQKNTPEEISFEQLEKAVTASWPESQLIIGEHKLDINPLSLAVIYCPLYSKGPLEESGLIKYPEKMEDSRVAGKNYAYSKVISAINNCVKSVGGSVVLNSVFATKGVLLGNQPTEADYEALVYHQKLYLDFNKRISQETGIENHVLFKYDDSRKQPYVSFMDRLSKFVREDDGVLFTCGYSFSDQHINDLILNALEKSSTSRVIAFFFDEERTADGKMIYQLKED